MGNSSLGFLSLESRCVIAILFPTCLVYYLLQLSFDCFRINQSSHLTGMSQRSVAANQEQILSGVLLVFVFFDPAWLLERLFATFYSTFSDMIICLVSSRAERKQHYHFSETGKVC